MNRIYWVDQKVVSSCFVNESFCIKKMPFIYTEEEYDFCQPNKMYLLFLTKLLYILRSIISLIS